MIRKIALFFGAHPDDIEIGAGGTAAKLIALGWEVTFCIFTEESNPGVAAVRRGEAINAAGLLGVPANHVVFVQLKDAGLVGNSTEIDRTRERLVAATIDLDRVDLVFSHSKADVHTDHKRAHDIVQVVMRGRPILHYPIVNHMVQQDFEPDVIVDVAATHSRKLEALEAHESQIRLGRIKRDDIEELSKRYGRLCGTSHGEAFELDWTVGTPRDAIRCAQQLNDRRRRSHLPWVAILVCVAALLLLGLRHCDGGWGQRGAILVDEFVAGSHISGHVTDIAPEEYGELKILVYLLTDKWYVHPWAEDTPGKGFAPIEPDGSWRIETLTREHRARRVAFLLTRKEVDAPARLHVYWKPDRELLWRMRPLAATILSGPDAI